MKILISITLLLLTTYTWAQIVPKYSNEFLNIGVGGRGLAMAGNQVSIVNDVTAGYWNPAGLLNIKEKYQASLMHAEYFAGIAQYDFASFATPVDSNSHIGLSVIRFGVDDIPDTRFLYDANGVLNYNNVRFFSAADYAFLLSYAKRTRLLGGMRWGANFKIIHRQAGDFATAWGFGLDAGAQIDFGKWHLGAMARDVLSTFTAWNHNLSLLYTIYAQTGNPLPQNSVEITLPRLALELSREVNLSQKIGLLAAVNFQNTFDGQRNEIISTNVISLAPSLGIELDYSKKVFLRGGVGNFQRIKNFDNTTFWTQQFNFGMGVALGKFMIDYAFTDVGTSEAGLYSHVFSLKAGFNASDFMKEKNKK